MSLHHHHCSSYHRVPQDEQNSIWRTAITAYSVPPYQGFVCIKHFDKDDLIGKQRLRLKKDTIPKVFTATENIPVNNAIDLIDSSEIFHNNKEENNSQNSCMEGKFAQGAQSVQNSENRYKSSDVIPCCCKNAELYNVIKAEYANLKQDYIENNTKKCLEIAKLQNELKKYKTKKEIRTDEVNYLSKKIAKLEKSENSLKRLVDTLKDLEAEKMISKEAYEALEVT